MLKNSLGIVKRPQLGGDVDAYCGKCKEVREHVIAAVNPDGAIGRVECRTCHSNHIYRERAAKATTTRSSTRASKKDLDFANDGVGPLRAYSMQERFAAGDRVDHPKFGVGLVVEVRAGKIDVKFGREVKTLIHAG
jgi:hypothetical protein